ncbi:MAG: transposase [Acidobacteriaceae bacterium]|nr:transposase [Acidobacteriaceae bacterium]
MAFLDAQTRAFEMFGGVFAVLRFDNLKSIVKRILQGKRREEAARFVAFRSHYLFAAEFCTPARGNEKGGVEQEIGRFRRRWWTPVPQCANLDELNAYLRRCSERDRERQIEGRSQRVCEAFEREQRYLRKRPADDFDLCEKLACTVDGHGCVSVKYNRYSTPLRPGARVEAQVDATYVSVWSEGRRVARHERCYSKRQEVLDLEHYLTVLERKPGALAHSKALTQYREAGLWPESFDQLWAKLKERHGDSQGTREMIGLLLQIPLHGHRQVRAAIEGALACSSHDAATVLHLLKPGTRAEHRAAPLVGTGDGYDRPLPNLEIYDQLLSAPPQTEVRL